VQESNAALHEIAGDWIDRRDGQLLSPEGGRPKSNVDGAFNPTALIDG
jgi:hypothetical protein